MLPFHVILDELITKTFLCCAFHDFGPKILIKASELFLVLIQNIA